MLAATRQATLFTKTICPHYPFKTYTSAPNLWQTSVTCFHTTLLDLSEVDKFTEKTSNSSPQQARVHVQEASQTSPVTPDS